MVWILPLTAGAGARTTGIGEAEIRAELVSFLEPFRAGAGPV